MYGDNKLINIIKSILDIDQNLTGLDYLKEYIKNIAINLDIKYVLIGHPLSDLSFIQTDVVWADGKFVDNFQYELKDTPCEFVITGERVCIHERDVCVEFPDDLLLQEMKIESYIGAPVVAKNQSGVGSILVLLDVKPMEDRDFIVAITDFLAVRASAEMDKHLIEESLKEQVKIKTQKLEQTKKELDIALEKSQRKANRFFELSINLLVIADLEANIIDINDTWLKSLGYTLDELKGKKVLDYIHPDDIKSTLEAIYKLDHGETVENFVNRYRHKDGTYRILSWNANFEPIEKLIYASAQDITKKVEFSKRYEKMFNNIQEGVMIASPDGYIKDVNKAFKIITGYSSEEVIGKSTSLLKSGKHDNSFYKDMWSDIDKKGMWSGQIYNKKKNGDIYTSFLTISTIKDSEDRVENYIAIFADISKILNYEKELREKDRQLIQQSKMATMGEMIGNISHQMKQPLNIISTYASAAQFKKEFNNLDDEYLDEVLDGVLTNTQYLATTIDDFRDFFKPNNNQFIDLKLAKLIEKTLKLIDAQFKTRNIILIKNIEDIEINSVENALVQVLINILNNARDELIKKDDPRLILIDVFKDNENLHIKILDNAGGIADDIIDKVFDSYFTTKAENHGTGIGLYMSKDIVHNLLNGSLSVSNKLVSYEDIEYKGAEFSIELPLQG